MQRSAMHASYKKSSDHVTRQGKEGQVFVRESGNWNRHCKGKICNSIQQYFSIHHVGEER